MVGGVIDPDDTEATVQDIDELTDLDLIDHDEERQPDPNCVRCGGQESPCPVCNPRVRAEP